jgi:hypothetical protein
MISFPRKNVVAVKGIQKVKSSRLNGKKKEVPKLKRNPIKKNLKLQEIFNQLKKSLSFSI